MKKIKIILLAVITVLVVTSAGLAYRLFTVRRNSPLSTVDTIISALEDKDFAEFDRVVAVEDFHDYISQNAAAQTLNENDNLSAEERESLNEFFGQAVVGQNTEKLTTNLENYFAGQSSENTLSEPLKFLTVNGGSNRAARTNGENAIVTYTPPANIQDSERDYYFRKNSAGEWELYAYVKGN